MIPVKGQTLSDTSKGRHLVIPVKGQTLGDTSKGTDTW